MSQIMQHKAEVATDVGMIGLLGGAFVELLPVWVSLVTLLWFLIKIWETDTVKKVTKRKKKDDA